MSTCSLGATIAAHACRFASATQPNRRRWTKQQMYDAVYKGVWLDWARSSALSPEEISMSFGPTLAYDVFWKADFQAVQFTCKHAERKNQTCNSLVLVKHTEESASDEPTLTTPYVGRVNVWLRHTPPWVQADATPKQIENEAQLLCDVSWYKYKGVQPGLYNCPVVSKNFFDYADGNFEFADNLEPTAISLVPYIGRNFAVTDSQQVIVTDVSVFKPSIS